MYEILPRSRANRPVSWQIKMCFASLAPHAGGVSAVMVPAAPSAHSAVPPALTNVDAGGIDIEVTLIA
jgi:hypothetical protein